MRSSPKAPHPVRLGLSILILLLSVASAWSAFEDIGGMKYSNGFYMIENANHLADLAVYVNGSGTYSTGVTNTTAHDATGLGFRVSQYYSGQSNSSVALTPIGTYKSKFNGTFDGNDVRIIGLKIGHTDNDYGLFGYIGSNGYVGGLILEAPKFDGTITKGEASIGIIAAHNSGRITLSEVRKGSSSSTLNVSMSGTHTAYIGGLVGYNSGEISQCKNKYNLSVSGSTSGRHYVGGIAGYSYSNSQITLNLVDSVSLSTSTSGSKTYGAIIGYNSGTLDRNFYHNVKTGGNSSYQTGIGTGSGDVSSNNGAIAVFRLTSENGDVEITTSPFTYGVLNKAPYYAYNSSATLKYYTNVSDGYYVQYTIASKKYNGATGSRTLAFTIPAKDATITGADLKATSYTISYNLSNWTVPSSAPTAYSVEYHPNLPSPTRTGYTFDGWYTKSDYSGSKVTYVPSTTGNITFYGKWIPNTYTVRFNSNDGTDRTATQNFSYGESKPLQANPFTPASGYGDLIKWTTLADGSGTSFSNQESVKDLRSSEGAIIDIYAQWKKDIATNEDITISEIPDQEYTGDLIKPAVTVMDGSTNINSEVNINYSNNINVGEATVTISAKSTSTNYSGLISKTFNIVPRNYKITYILYGGTNPENAPTTYTIESEDVTLPTPSKTGYFFGGWYADEGFSTKVTTIASEASSDTTIHAKWIAIKYSVKFNANGGSGEMEKQQFIYDVEKNLNANTFIPPQGKGGFLAWNTRSDGKGSSYSDGESVVSLSSTPNGIVDLYAQWKDLISEDDYYIPDIDDQEFTGNPIEPEIYIVKDMVDVSDNFIISYSNNVYIGTATVTITVDPNKMPNYDGSFTKTFNIVGNNTTYAFVEINEVGGKKYAIVDGNYTGDEPFNISKDIEVDDVKFNREFPITDGMNFSTITLPFEVNTSQLDGVQSIVEFAQVGNNKETGMMQVEVYLVWKKGDAHVDLSANKPYMIQMEDAQLKIDGPVIFKPTSNPIVTDDEGKWSFVGTYAFTSWDKNNNDLGRVYGFSAAPFEANNEQYNAGQFHKFATGSFIKPMRAYLRYNTSVPKNQPAMDGRRNAPIASIDEELPDRMNVVIVERDGEKEHTTVIGTLDTRTGEIRLNTRMQRTFDIKGRKVNSTNKAHKAYYGKKVLKK